VQFEKWDAILSGGQLPEFGKARQDAWRHWARALAYANQSNLASAQEESRLFEKSMDEFRARTGRSDPAELQVARQELAGHIELASGRVGQALKQLAAASKAERRLTYTEPPYYPRPVAEAMGHLALRNHQPAAAQKAFRTALEQYPADAHAAEGLKLAQAEDSTKLVAAR
jgi:predicted negative regulator of RcsB-dependent stress response